MHFRDQTVFARHGSAGQTLVPALWDEGLFFVAGSIALPSDELPTPQEVRLLHRVATTSMEVVT